MTTAIPDDVRDLLARSRIDGRNLFLPEQLSRPLYESVAKTLKAAGARWERRSGAHVFADDASELVADMVTTGEVFDHRRELGFYETPSDVAQRLFDFAAVKIAMHVLEPSAGGGVIARHARRLLCGVTCVEIDRQRANLLEGQGFDVICDDFLTLEPQPTFDRIIANPPFAKGADVRHVTRMLDWRAPGGFVVAVMSAGVTFRMDAATRALREQLAVTNPLPDGAFKEAGTGVRTVLVVSHARSRR